MIGCIGSDRYSSSLMFSAFLYRTLDFTHNLKKNPSEVIESNILSLDNRTIINVCHKFNQNNLNKYDKIYVIEGGRLVVEGNYSEIHNNKIFKKMLSKSLINKLIRKKMIIYLNNIKNFIFFCSLHFS